MDPNENIRQQRQIAEAIIRTLDEGIPVSEQDAERLAELVLALDSWLLKGGALPRGWTIPGSADSRGER